MGSRDSEKRMGAWMQFLGRKIETSGNVLLRDTGITVMQLRVLRYLKTHPEQPQIADIADFFGVKHTSTIHVVRALEEKGYIYREPIHRSHGKKIKLTEQGDQLAANNEDRIDQMEEIMLRGFSEEEKTVLFQFLSRINENFDREFGLQNNLDNAKIL